jgi:Rod binding domain-containing protein
MDVTALQSRRIVASDIAPEQLAGNTRLTENQKIGEASRQFEAVLLRQILSESQKNVMSSESADNSTTAGIYQDLITNTLADNISKSGKFGLAKVFEQQLSHPVRRTATANAPTSDTDLAGTVSGK